MERDSSYWNERFRSRENRLMEPEEYLVKHVGQLWPGTVLDVACGDGRNAVYLSRSGYEVTGVDFAGQGLARLQGFAASEGLHLHTLEMNAGDARALTSLGTFDNAVFIHFRPSLDVFLAVFRLIQSSGILLLTSFNERHLQEYPDFPSELCFGPEEYRDLTTDLELLEHISYQDDRGWLDGYVFRKKP